MNLLTNAILFQAAEEAAGGEALLGARAAALARAAAGAPTVPHSG